MKINLIGTLVSGPEPSDYRAWKPWFAWRPQIVEGHLVWLETIYRRKAGVYPPTMACPHDYRLTQR